MFLISVHDLILIRTLNSIVGWVKTILQQEQKKSDFNPTGSASGAPLATASSACVRVNIEMSPYVIIMTINFKYRKCMHITVSSSRS